MFPCLPHGLARENTGSMEAVGRKKSKKVIKKEKKKKERKFKNQESKAKLKL